MKSAVFQEYIIRIKISKVIFFLIFDIITLESWEGVRIEKKGPRTYTCWLRTIWIPSLKCFFVILEVYSFKLLVFNLQFKIIDRMIRKLSKNQ
jgi:hypothetical protein